MAEKKNARKIKEASIIIRPIRRLGGLDNIHVLLIILVAVLIALLLVVTYSEVLPKPNPTLTNCTYGTSNGTCIMPLHNYTTVKLAAERFLASYRTINNSLSLLPFISEVNSMALSYSSSNASWYATVPFVNPADNSTLYFTMLINDMNLSNVVPFLQTFKPAGPSEDHVVSRGVISLAGKVQCRNSSPLQAYWFMDPYSPGSVPSLSIASAEKEKFGGKLGIGIDVLFTQSSQVISSTYGLNNTLALGEYIMCASQQSQFGSFVRKLGSVYSDSYLSPEILSGISNASSLNYSAMQSCIGSAPTLINRQAVLAKYYNITSTPSVVTDCKYLSLPQTESYAICYSNSTLC